MSLSYDNLEIFSLPEAFMDPQSDDVTLSILVLWVSPKQTLKNLEIKTDILEGQS